MSRIAFLFPGQGAQFVGMGKSIAAQHHAARALYDRASEILGYDLAARCFSGPADELNSTVVSQPAIFVTSLACLEKLKAEQPGLADRCEAAAGLSLGEYTALVFAGAMSFEEGLRIVQQRGQAMQSAADATPSGMVSILLLDLEKVEAIRAEASKAGRLWIANYLCPGNIVLSGEKAACAKALELAEAGGGRAVPLTVAGAFHTEIMRPADETLAKALAPVRLQRTRIPVISNVDAAAHSEPDSTRAALVQQVLSPVRWEDSMKSLLSQGFDEFYEIGPGKVLTGLLKRINRKTPCTPVNDG